MGGIYMKQWYMKFLPVVFFFCLFSCATGGGETIIEPQKQAKAIRKLGEAYLGERNYTMALSEFLKAEKLDPDDPILQQDLGIAYMAKDDLETAVLHFKKALEIDPDYAEATNNLGAAYLAMEKWDSAIACFEMLKEDLLYETPHYPLANLGKAYYEKKDYSEAEKYYQEALTTKPGFVNALFGLGKTYLAMGKVKKAVGALEEAVEVAPGLAEAHFELATAYRLLGNKVKAKSEYEKVLSLEPDSDLARESKQELAPMNN
jgi:Tfp pilus assembly protein PilF